MKHFVGFTVFVFAALLGIYFYSENTANKSEDKKIYVYASSSFVAKWGAGPALKEAFEKQNIFKVEFIEISDLAMALQKISFENESSLADVVLGIDQFDAIRAASKIQWRDIPRNQNIKFASSIAGVSQDKNFVPYDWAPMSFIARKDLSYEVSSISDLLHSQFTRRIALQDPRTSSPGLQFLSWVFLSKSPDEALQYLKGMAKQAHSFSPSWSASYGLFTNRQADLVFSYVTSPIYHQVEESDAGYVSIETTEPLPLQVEFAGIPATCKNCEAAEMFVNFLLSAEAQKIIMSKNYMLPVIEHAKEGTLFDAIKIYRTLPAKFYEPAEIEKWVATWSEIRKNEGL